MGMEGRRGQVELCVRGSPQLAPRAGRRQAGDGDAHDAVSRAPCPQEGGGGSPVVTPPGSLLLVRTAPASRRRRPVIGI